MTAGHWKFSFTPNFDWTASNFISLLQVYDSTNELIFLTPPGAVIVYVFSQNDGGTQYFAAGPITFSASQTITVEVDWPGNTCTITGATTGDGPYTGTSSAGFAWFDNLSIGHSPSLGSGWDFDGSISNIEDFSASGVSGTGAAAQPGLTGAASGLVGVAGTAAGAQPGLSGAATGALTITGTAAGARPGLTGAAAGLVGATGTAAGAQPGLTGSSSGALTLAGTAAGAQPGLTGVASGALTVAGSAASSQPGLTSTASGLVGVTGTGAGAQAGLSASSSGALTLTGSAAGTQPGLVAAATSTSSTSGTVAGAQPGLAGAASGALTLAGTAAGSQTGLSAAAAGALTVAGSAAGQQAGLVATATSASVTSGTAAGAQSGLTGAASGALTLVGAGAGAQSGLTGAAAGALTLTGSAAAAQPGLVGSAVAPNAGAAASALAGLSAAASGALTVVGTSGAGAQPGLSAAATGASALAGIGAGAQGGLAGAAVGSLRITSTVAAVLSQLLGAAVVDSGTPVPEGTVYLHIRPVKPWVLVPDGNGGYWPAIGANTYLTPRILNQILRGQLLCSLPREVLTGAAAAGLAGTVGAAVGAFAIAGTAASSGTLDLAALQPPSTVSVPLFMRTGAWRVVVTLSSAPGNDAQIFNVGGLNSDSLFLTPAGGANQYYVQLYASGTGYALSGVVTATILVGAPVTLDVNFPAGTLTISGASAGNGTTSLTSTSHSWASGTMGVGRLSTSSSQLLSAVLSNVIGSGGGASMAGLVASASGAGSVPDPGPGFALLVDSDGDYLVDSDGDYLYGDEP